MLSPALHEGIDGFTLPYLTGEELDGGEVQAIQNVAHTRDCGILHAANAFQLR